MSDQKISINWVPGPVRTLLGILTAMVGFTIHGSIFWACMDFIFWPVALCYWLVTHQLTASVVKITFAFLYQ